MSAPLPRAAIGRPASETPAPPDHAFRAVADHTDCAILIHRGSRFIYVNDAAARVTGFSREQLLGMHHSGIVHPQSLTLMSARGQARMRGDEAGLIYQIRLNTTDGVERWVDVSTCQIDFGGTPAVLATYYDVSERKRAESAQLEIRDLLDQIIANTPVATFVVDVNHVVTHWNRACENLLGVAASKIVGSKKHGWALYSEDRPVLADLIVSGAREAEFESYYQSRFKRSVTSAGAFEAEVFFPRLRNGAGAWLFFAAAPLLDREGRIIGAIETMQDITELRSAELAHREARELAAQIIEGGPVPTFAIDADHCVTHWNRACEVVLGVSAQEMIGKREVWRAFYDTQRPIMADLVVSGALDEGVETYFQDKFKRSTLVKGAFEAEDFFPRLGDGGRWFHFTAMPIRDSEGRVVGAIETLQDISERKKAETALVTSKVELERLVKQRTAQLASANAALEADVERRELIESELRKQYDELSVLNSRLGEAQSQLMQSEKMASVGQLAAGVAHEINNPIGYVHSNLGSLETYITDLFKVIESYRQIEHLVPNPSDAIVSLHRLHEELDLPFLKEDVPSLLTECKEGIARVKKIVQDLKDFSRVDDRKDWQLADLHQGIDSTLNIVASELKYRAEVVKQYGELPEVECFLSQLNQVFMNLLVNAAHAIEGPRGTITISTGSSGEEVWVAIADTGKGIAKENLARIFDPFFTTKPVGKGTGLGLSLSYGIVQKHNGRIDVDSDVGRGTTFRVTLPVKQIPANPQAAMPEGADLSSSAPGDLPIVKNEVTTTSAEELQ